MVIPKKLSCVTESGKVNFIVDHYKRAGYYLTGGTNKEKTIELFFEYRKYNAEGKWFIYKDRS